MSLICKILYDHRIFIDQETLLHREMIGNNVTYQNIAFPQMIWDVDQVTEIIIHLDRPIVWVNSFVRKIVLIIYPKQFYLKYEKFYALVQRFIVDSKAIHTFLSLEDTNDMMTFLSSYK